MKRFSRFLAILAALLMLCTSALADLQVYCPNVQVAYDGFVRAIVYASKDGSLTAEDMTVTMDATEVTPNVYSFERSDMGTSYVFVVDLSTLDRADHAKALLTGLVSNLGEFDNAAIYTTAMQQSDIQLTQDKTALGSRIDGLKKDSKSPALNSKVADVIAYLGSSSEAGARKSIVIISNGQNADTSLTQEELISKADETEAVIYTVALQASKNVKTDKVNAFGSIARSSKGGLAITLPNSTKDMSTAIAQITSNENRFRVIEVDPVSLAAAPAEMSITIRDGSFEQSVTTTFNAVERQAIQDRIAGIEHTEPGEPTPEPTATAVPTPTPKPFPYNLLEGNMLLIVLGAVLAVLVIVLVVVLVSKKNRANRDVHPESESGSVTTAAEGVTEAVDPGVNTFIGTTVFLEQVGINENRRYSAQITDTIVVGRVASKSRIVIPDEKVSGAHLRLIYAGGRMYAEDMMSRNGTKVNNMPISGRVPLQKQDVITIGLTNLRINWQ